MCTTLFLNPEYKVTDGHLVENNQKWFVGRRHF